MLTESDNFLYVSISFKSCRGKSIEYLINSWTIQQQKIL